MSDMMLSWIGYAGGAAALLIAALWGHVAFWSWYYRQREVCGGLSWVYTPDGWKIALEHLPPRRGEAPRGQVICYPGLACNGRLFHLREGLSMARELSDAGWSVWIVHPRGMGLSEAPARAQRNHGYETYLDDVELILDFVKARSELPIMWIGHSLGGLVGIQTAARHPETLVGVVTLGSPVALREHTVDPVNFAIFKWFCRGLELSRLGLISTIVAPWSGWIPALHPKPLYVNFDLISKHDLRTSLAQCFDDTPRRLIDEFVSTIERGEGPWERVQQDLRELKVPLLAFSGGRDRLAPREVSAQVETWGPAGQTRWIQLDSYGHLELVLSEGMKHDVIPELLAWLDEVAVSQAEESQTEESQTKESQTEESQTEESRVKRASSERAS